MLHVCVTQCFVFSFRIGDVVGGCNCFLYPERDGKSQNLITYISDGENHQNHITVFHTLNAIRLQHRATALY